MINVDAGNSPHRPDNPVELRRTWRLTWLAILGVVVLVVVVVIAGTRQGGGSPDRDVQQDELAGPGERERSSRPRSMESQPRN